MFETGFQRVYEEIILQQNLIFEKVTSVKNFNSQLDRKDVAIYPKLSQKTLENWVYNNRLELSTQQKNSIFNDSVKLRQLVKMLQTK